MKKKLSKSTSIWYELFVIVQQTPPFPQTRLEGLNDVTADYLWRSGPATLALNFYWYISVISWYFVIFCQFKPYLLNLNDVTRGYLWRPATLALSALHIIQLHFVSHICPVLFSYLSTSIYHVLRTWPMWQCIFLTFCFFRESPWQDSLQHNFQYEL